MKPNMMLTEEPEQAAIEIENLEESIVNMESLTLPSDVTNIIQEQQPCSQNPSESLSSIIELVYILKIFYKTFIFFFVVIVFKIFDLVKLKRKDQQYQLKNLHQFLLHLIMIYLLK